ncbi:unnamed protein product [Xylocopa violacea]|uniref:Peptidoglycan-recognition protein n=1 Tax=Xylocopa violacea TaxID=135666 RepID=A0ABP1PAY7_XYLVO
MKFSTFLISLMVAVILTATAKSILAIPLSWAIANNDTEVPHIVSRREWRARPPLDKVPMEVTPTPYVVIHHGGIARYCYNQNDCSAIVRSYQNLHIDDRGWFDIGYSFVVGEDGNVYEGRGWDYIGAHAPGYNTQSIGICVIGDFSDFLPNEKALNAVKALIDYGVSLGKISEDYHVIGHRQARNTACPGTTFYKYVQTHLRWTNAPIPKFSNSTTTTERTSTSHPQFISVSMKKMKVVVAVLLLCSCQALLAAVHETPVRPKIISRSEWGAKSPKRTVPNLKVDPPPFVIIHHSASDGCTTQAICQARVRSFQKQHMDNNGWADIGYQFLVGEDGNIYEGRGWDKQGAHSTSYNSRSIGICIIGNFVGHNPNAAAIKAAQDLISYGVAIGKIQENYTLLGHRQTTATICPGDSLYELIKTWPHWARIQ